MLRPLLFVAVIILPLQLLSQTGIGTTTPHSSAKLDVTSTDKGFLPPRVSLTNAYDRNTISSPATGLLVYCKGDAGLAAGYYYWNGSAWATIATEGGSGSVAAEYGAEFLSSNVSVTSSTPVDVITFTLPSAGTWEVISFLRAQGSAGFAAEFAIYEANGTKVPNSEILSAYGESASTGTGVIRITTNGAATYKLKAFATTLSFQAFTDVNGRTGVTWKKISGNAPVTGQSVDYIQASLSANQTVSAIGNINFNSSTGTGISISSGGFNLIANKTYKLEAAVGGSSTGYAYYAWVDNANNILSGGSIGVVMKAGNSYTDAPQDKAVVYYTPTANTTVYLRVVSIAGSLTAFAPSVASGYSSAWATIQQVGSSAIINPWVLSGNNVYNTTGNVGIGTSAPQSTLDIRGSQAQNYTATSSTSYTILPTDNVIDLTLLGTQTVTNFTASTSNLNRILTIVNNTNVTTKTISSYVNNLGTSVTTIPANSTLIIQSTGTTWKQINGIAASSNTIITTTNGNGSAGQFLSSNGNGTYTWVSGPMSLRVLSNAGVTIYTQSQLQTLYNNVTGFNAPDIVPIEVVNAANALNNTNYKVYLGHNKWWYTNAQSGTTSSWILFGGASNKSDFSANIAASGLFTYK